jgi:hypothetical protein
MTVPKRTVVLSVPTLKSKSLLDTRMLRALKERYRVIVVGYLSDRPDIIDAYAEQDLEFAPAAKPSRKVGHIVARLLESTRELGFQFHYRRHPWVGMAWRATLKFRNLEPIVQRPLVRRAFLRALAFSSQRRWLWRRYARLLSRFIRDRELEEMLVRERPEAVILTGQGQSSPQELVLGMAAQRFKLRTIWLPITNDDPMFNGHLVTEHDAVCSWGPIMTTQFHEFHGIPTERIIRLGNVSTRMQEDLIEEETDQNLHERLGIPPDRPIVTYFSVINSAATASIPAVDALSAAVGNGRLNGAAIVVRPSPVEDNGPLMQRYENDPNVWVQNTGAHEFDGAGSKFFAEHAVIVKESDILILGSLTSAQFQSAVWGVRTILNATELEDYPTDAYKPTVYEDVDLAGFFSSGLAVAHDFDELCDLTVRYLDDPSEGLAACSHIARDWDYQNENYIEDFLQLIARVGEDQTHQA